MSEIINLDNKTLMENLFSENEQLRKTLKFQNFIANGLEKLAKVQYILLANLIRINNRMTHCLRLSVSEYLRLVVHADLSVSLTFRTEWVFK